MAKQPVASVPIPRNFDVELKELEILGKQQDLDTKRQELAFKKHWSARWNSPVVMAVLAALVGYFGTLITWTLAQSDEQKRHQRTLELEEAKQKATERLEQKRLEGTLILDAVKTGEGSEKAERAAANLLLLADAKLITLDAETRAKLAERAGDVGPGLPSTMPRTFAGAGIIGADDAVPVAALPRSSPLRKAAQAVAILRVSSEEESVPITATAFLVSEDLVVTSVHSLRAATKASLLFSDVNGDESYDVELPPLDEATDESGFNFALLRVKEKPGRTRGWLPLANEPPKLHTPVAMVFYRGNGQALVVSGEPDCRVQELNSHFFTHRCDTGAGASGAPVLSNDGSLVWGLHDRRSSTGGVAWRADVIAERVRSHLP